MHGSHTNYVNCNIEGYITWSSNCLIWGREIQKIKIRLANRAVEYGGYKRDSTPRPGPPAAAKVNSRTKEAWELKKRKTNKLNSSRPASSNRISAFPTFTPAMPSTARSTILKKRLEHPLLKGRLPIEAPKN